jgi:3-deoxy-manno-octulosonate cytidylyltransferase (CMP-KDO synthetase)
MMTSPDHATGTDRAAEVARRTDADAFINVQGDEPEIDPAVIDAVTALLQDDRADVATMAVRSSDRARFLDPNTVKVVTDREGFALYFSRSPLPGGKKLEQWAGSGAFSFLIHVGLYGFRRDFLMRFAELPGSPLEELESLEQLRALENGYRIKVGIAKEEPVGVDTPDDYRRFVERHRGQMGSDQEQW